MSDNRLARILAKIFFIDLDYRKDEPKEFTGEGSGAVSAHSVDTFVEQEPTVKEYLSRFVPSKEGSVEYFKSLFPFWSWIFHYNATWLLGDVIAGVTVGFVVVPQGMAYALLAQLGPEYGLYTSFVGFLLYWAFATSKDITIGTVAVMSTIVGNIVLRVQDIHPDIPADNIARGLSVICGAFLLFIGLVRWGWVVEFIPLVAITSFMTGAAISIAIGQVPALLGIRGINTREAAYLVLINTLKALPRAKIDAAMGLSALFLLYLLRWFCNFMQAKQPHKRKMWFFLSTLRMAFVILLYTLISFLVNRNVPESEASKAKFRVLGKVPSGFQHAGVPQGIDMRLLKALAPDLPASIIVLIIEHIAISKSFGRINNYVINPSQELVAMGFTNLFGPFLGGYPATGSFSRTAIKSKAGVRTPLAGVFTAVIVLLALYALTKVFFYIPMASLSGLIIHAVGDLITEPNVVYQFWEVSPFEVVIFFAGVILTLFTNIENGIYLTVAASAAMLLFRIAKAKGRLLGRVKIYRVPDHKLKDGDFSPDDRELSAREAFLPLDHEDGTNPDVEIQQPYPGIFIYRFSEGFNYLNQAEYLDALTAHIFKETRRTRLDNYEKIGDRPWNDPGPRRGQKINFEDNRPILKAVIFDFSSVNNIDVTSIQGLIDIANQLDKYAAPAVVEFHFASVHSRWTKRALAVAGFGYRPNKNHGPDEHMKPIFSVAKIDAASDQPAPKPVSKDEEDGITPAGEKSESHQVTTKERITTVHGINRPYFHIDVSAAVETALANAERRAGESGGSGTASLAKAELSG